MKLGDCSNSRRRRSVSAASLRLASAVARAPATWLAMRAANSPSRPSRMAKGLRPSNKAPLGGLDDVAGSLVEPIANAVHVADLLPAILGRHIAVLVRQLMRRPHRLGHGLVVIHQLAQHVARPNVTLVVVGDRLQLADMPNRAQRQPADLAHPFRQFVRAGEDLVGLFVQHQVVVAEVRPADVPMEILGLEIEREGVGQQTVQRLRNLGDGLLGKIGRRVEFGGGTAALEWGDFAHGMPRACC